MSLSVESDDDLSAVSMMAEYYRRVPRGNNNVAVTYIRRDGFECCIRTGHLLHPGAVGLVVRHVAAVLVACRLSLTVRLTVQSKSCG